MKQSLFKIGLLVLVVGFFACKKKHTEPAPDPNKKGSAEVYFDNFVGSQELKLNVSYNNPITGESFTPTLLKYFISNIELKTANGTTFVVPQEQSYFLIDQENPASKKCMISEIPEGDYSEITFLVGVDSLRNTKPTSERTGVLDISGAAQGMYWSWNSGYIFVKFEGNSPQSAATDKKFRYHIGGFGGYSSPTINCIRKVTLSFGNDRLKVRQGKTPSLHLIADFLKFFNGNYQLKIANNHTVMFNPLGVQIANNYQNMFSYDHVHDDGH
ncbi:MAG: hypothetical protein RMJ97_01600 [Raineya sp.]|nr:hypothetical protein [Raineya sp.]